MNGKIITVFGGSGFLGRYVVRALAKRGWRVRVGVRKPESAYYIQPSGVVGQVHAVYADILNRSSVSQALDGADAAINLVGILNESGKQTFPYIHVDGAALIAKEVSQKGISRFVHTSALCADSNSASEYARTKALGEEAVLSAMPDANIVRPSLVFGAEDDFFNRFAKMAMISPIIPLLGGGETKFQPVYVVDVADSIVNLVSQKGEQKKISEHGKIYELGGDEIFSFKELMELTLKIIQRKRSLVNIPFSVANFAANLLEIFPFSPLSVDQVLLLKQDSIVSKLASEQQRVIRSIGVTPKSCRDILPNYLYCYRPHGQFARASA